METLLKIELGSDIDTQIKIRKVDPKIIANSLAKWGKYYKNIYYENEDLNNLLESYNAIILSQSKEEQIHSILFSLKKKIENFMLHKELIESQHSESKEINQLLLILENHMEILLFNINDKRKKGKEKKNTFRLAIDIIAIISSVSLSILSIIIF